MIMMTTHSPVTDRLMFVAKKRRKRSQQWSLNDFILNKSVEVLIQWHKRSFATTHWLAYSFWGNNFTAGDTNIHLEPWYSNHIISLVFEHLVRVSHGCTCDNPPGCYFSTWFLVWSWPWEGGVLNEVSKLFYPACKCHWKMEKTDLLLAWGLKLRLTDETDCLLIHWLMVFSLGPAKKHEWRTWLVMLESSDFIWYSVNIMFLDEAWLPERELLTCLNTIHSLTIPKQHALHWSRPLMAPELMILFWWMKTSISANKQQDGGCASSPLKTQQYYTASTTDWFCKNKKYF